MTLRLTPLLAAVLLAACGGDPDPSSSIPTERIYARYVAETRADGSSTVTAEYLEDEGLFYYEGVYLDGGDTVTFRARDEQVSLPGGDHFFVTELLSGIVEDTRFEFDLQRPVHADAPGSFGTLPPPMTLEWPQDGAEYSIASDAVTVFWSNAGKLDDMSVRVQAWCLDPVEDDLNEAFTVKITGDPGLARFSLAEGLHREDECRRYDATLSLLRARAGTVDAALAPNENACGGDNQPECRHLEYVSVRQVRSVALVLRP